MSEWNLVVIIGTDFHQERLSNNNLLQSPRLRLVWEGFFLRKKVLLISKFLIRIPIIMSFQKKEGSGLSAPSIDSYPELCISLPFRVRCNYTFLPDFTMNFLNLLQLFWSQVHGHANWVQPSRIDTVFETRFFFAMHTRFACVNMRTMPKILAGYIAAY